MKLLFGSILFAIGLSFAYSVGNVNEHWTIQNILAGFSGGLVASVGVAWSLKS